MVETPYFLPFISPKSIAKKKPFFIPLHPWFIKLCFSRPKGQGYNSDDRSSSSSQVSSSLDALARSEGLPQGVAFGFISHSKSNGALPRSGKHKADAHAFSTYWGDKLPMPLQFYTDFRVLKAVGLSPIADADLGALEALRVS
ncbi:hypothetical protein LIER_12858 [Lithospermum erythrorhizon]|uniref:Uncharacterized protein n=1 Tax=Lithospermum erythrorhizon TaxID=34254 RepID=A0AAV3PTJ2_LITER